MAHSWHRGAAVVLALGFSVPLLGPAHACAQDTDTPDAPGTDTLAEDEARIVNVGGSGDRAWSRST